MLIKNGIIFKFGLRDKIVRLCLCEEKAFPYSSGANALDRAVAEACLLVYNYFDTSNQPIPLGILSLPSQYNNHLFYSIEGCDLSHT